MIISIWKKQDLSLVNELPTEVLSAIETTIEILDENYGTERTTEDLGGYVAVADKFGLEELKQHQLKRVVPEYIDEIEGTDYISVLFLCSSDFSIVVICKKELKDIIEKIDLDESDNDEEEKSENAIDKVRIGITKTIRKVGRPKKKVEVEEVKEKRRRGRPSKKEKVVEAK